MTAPFWDRLVCCSVTQWCPTLCYSMDCSMPGSLVLHYLLEFTQTHSHWVNDAIQPFVAPSSFCLQTFPASGFFPVSRLFTSGGQSIRASASELVFPMNIQDWFPLGFMVWSPCCPEDSQESSPAPQIESINSSALSLLYGPTLISVHDYWKNHSFDYMDLCWQSDVSAF